MTTTFHHRGRALANGSAGIGQLVVPMSSDQFLGSTLAAKG